MNTETNFMCYRDPIRTAAGGYGGALRFIIGAGPHPAAELVLYVGSELLAHDLSTVINAALERHNRLGREES